MSFKRILATGLVFAIACAGWWILGTATVVRSTNFFKTLGTQVETMWGTPLVQEAPSFSVEIPGSDSVRWLMPSKTDITADIQTDYRKKGLIWYSTYVCAFDGTYKITNSEDVSQKVRVHFKLPAEGATYDQFSVVINDRKITTPINAKEGIHEILELAPAEEQSFRITYRTRGLNTWLYKIDPRAGRVQNFDLTMKTDFGNVDFPEGSLSPMSTDATESDATLTWSATDLITTQDMGVVIPERLNPGPLTSRITFFAPVCLLFFFVVVATISLLYKIDIHPMHYLFVAAGFFAFHLLLSYMVGIVNIHLAFLICTITTITLVTSYLSAALKGRFPARIAVLGQLFYLVLFSYSFFLDGLTGLTVAIGSVVTLGLLMRVTAHINWSEVMAKPRSTPPPLTGRMNVEAEA